jgi:hypothetical protein
MINKIMFMKYIFKVTVFACVLLFSASCYDESKLPFPQFAEGSSFRVVPKTWSARPTFSLATPLQSFTLSLSSYNASTISQVEVYVSFLPNTAVPAAMGTGNFNQFLAPVGTAGWIAEVPSSGTAPVTISYARYDQLINGKTTAGVTFTALPRVLYTTLTGSQTIGDFNVSLAELATAAGITLPASVPVAVSTATVVTQPAFLLTFEVTKKDGTKFTYLNSGPGVIINPPTGRVAPKTFTGLDIGGVPVVNKAYNLILSGEEGSPFVPGISIRIAP